MMNHLYVIKDVPEYLLTSKWVRESLARKLAMILTFRGTITDVKVFISVNVKHHQFVCNFTTNRNIVNLKKFEELVEKVSKAALYDVHAAYLNNESVKLLKTINEYVL